MRAFSDFEKKIIKCMIELDNSETLNVLGNLVHRDRDELSLFEVFDYVTVKSESDVVIHFRNKEKDGVENAFSLIKSVRIVTEKLLVMVMLFEYLQEERLAFFQGKTDGNSLGFGDPGVEYSEYSDLNPEIKALIYKYTKKKFFLTETLRVLARNHFKSEEELRHEEIQSSTKKQHEEIQASTQEQLVFTRWALGVSSVGLLLSIFIPLYSTTTVTINPKNAVEI